MEDYSPYFTTLYDQHEPTGYLGRGTHYSVLRAPSWHAPNSSISERAYHCDFAVIWDEDHDVRVIQTVEEIYLNGLLSKFIFFGERKGMFSAILSEHFFDANQFPDLKQRIDTIAATRSDGDSWSAEIYKSHETPHCIISDADDKISLYLNSIKMLWRLGGSPISSRRFIDPQVSTQEPSF